MTDNNTSTPESVGQDNARIPHHLVQLMMLAGRAGYVHEQMPSPTGRFDAFIADNHAFVMGEAGGAFTVSSSVCSPTMTNPSSFQTVWKA